MLLEVVPSIRPSASPSLSPSVSASASVSPSTSPSVSASVPLLSSGEFEELDTSPSVEAPLIGEVTRYHFYKCCFIRSRVVQ